MALCHATLQKICHHFKADTPQFIVRFQHRRQHFARTFATWKTHTQHFSIVQRNSGKTTLNTWLSFILGFDRYASSLANAIRINYMQ